MDVVSDAISDDSAGSSALTHIYDILAANNTSLRDISTRCALCHRILSSDDEPGNLEAANVCGDCKFLLLEDVDAISPYDYQRRIHRSRRRRYESSVSVESLFSQHVSRMITLERRAQSLVSDQDNSSVNGDGSGRLIWQTSSRTTPSGSRRWRRMVSDNESDGIQYPYAESESNSSYRGDRLFRGESDTVSDSGYGVESDISVDGHSFLGAENFGNADAGSSLESDTDIDPMNAGLYAWNSDQEDEDDDSEWDEAFTEQNMVESFRTGNYLHGSSTSSRSNAYVDGGRQLPSPEVEGSVPLRNRGRAQEHSPELLSNFEVFEAENYIGNNGDYLNSRGLESLLEHLTETESSRRGAPPAAVSFVKNMTQLRIDGQHDNLDNLLCAICKESLTVGTFVYQLPCFHIYHPSCILPWLNARNTCPLCRYELPTDDKDSEESPRTRRNRSEMINVHQHYINEDSSQDIIDSVADELSRPPHVIGELNELVNGYTAGENCHGETPRNRWFFLAAVAAPIVSMVGISLMLWLGKPSPYRRWPVGHIRRENSQKRWWSIF